MVAVMPLSAAPLVDGTPLCRPAPPATPHRATHGGAITCLRCLGLPSRHK